MEMISIIAEIPAPLYRLLRKALDENPELNYDRLISEGIAHCLNLNQQN
ncbi:hypothetical protein NDI45_08065 [Leptolyngbya sp. GB1-A1]